MLLLEVLACKSYAHIIQVEGHRYPFILLDTFPERPATVYSLQHQHSTLAHMAQSLVVPALHKHHIGHTFLATGQYCHALASVLAGLAQRFVKLATIHRLRAMIVGQSEGQMSQALHPALLPPVQIPVHLHIGIVPLLVVKHIRHQIKGKRRMNPVTLSFANAHQPYYGTLKQHHNNYKDKQKHHSNERFSPFSSLFPLKQTHYPKSVISVMLIITARKAQKGLSGGSPNHYCSFGERLPMIRRTATESKTSASLNPKDSLTRTLLWPRCGL